MSSPNLLNPAWAGLDSHELRLLLDHRIGGPGQYDRAAGRDLFYLPLAREQCKVALSYRDGEIAGIEPGAAFDPGQWAEIESEIETSVLTGPVKVGRDYSFVGHRVEGSWRGERSGVQILPPAEGAPLAPYEMGEHPFILEFSLRETKVWAVTNHRRLRYHRELTLLLNVLLRTRVNTQLRYFSHLWAAVPKPAPGANPVQWVQPFYNPGSGEAILDTPSPLTANRLEIIESDRYYTQPMGIDGKGLRVPDDLDESICRYQKLPRKCKEEFDRAAYWLDMAHRQHVFSLSASFASNVIAIEALINDSSPGSKHRYREFLETYAPGISLESRRNKMYALRSDILHGSKLMMADQDRDFGWDPPSWDERELMWEIYAVTATAMRNWLRSH